MYGAFKNPEDDNFLRYLQGRRADFQPYGAGAKRYGPMANNAPQSGGGLNKTGYRERDLKKKAMRNAMLRRMKAGQRGRFMSSDWMNPEGRSY